MGSSAINSMNQGAQQSIATSQAAAANTTAMAAASAEAAAAKEEATAVKNGFADQDAGEF